MDDDLSVSVDLEHLLAGVFSECLLLFVAGLLKGIGADEVQLLGKIQAPGDDGRTLFVKVEEFDDGLVDLLLHSREVVLKAPNQRAGLPKWISLFGTVRQGNLLS